MSISTQNSRMDFFPSMGERKKAAIARDAFFNENHYAIKRYLKLDLVNTYAIEDIPDLKCITYDFFISVFLERLVNVYNVAPVITFDEDVSQVDKDRVIDLLDEIDLQKTLQESAYKSRLHNTVLNYVRFNEELNKVYVSSDYNIGNCEVVTWDGYNYGAKIIAYEKVLNDKVAWYVWDRVNRQHYYVLDNFVYENGEVQGMKRPVPGNEKAIDPLAAPDYWPWIVRRYKEQDQDFWGHGLDSIIELNRVINVLSTITADDTINETLAVWLYNFNPEQAANKRSDGKLKVGFRNPLCVDQKAGIGGTVDPRIQIARADLQIEQITNFIDSISDKISNMFGVENALKQQMKQELSGIALRLRNEPILRQWNKDIGRNRKADRETIEAVINVNNYYRTGTDGLKDFEGNYIQNNYIDPAIMDKMQIDYQEPSVVTDETADFDIKERKAAKGLISWVGEFLKRNPEKTEKEAEQAIQENIKKNRELGGLSIQVNIDNSNDLENEMVDDNQ